MAETGTETAKKATGSWHEMLRTGAAVAAIAISLTAIFMQLSERAERRAEKAEKRAEILYFQIGGEQANAKQVDEFIRIYNGSVNDVYLESVVLRADMGDGLSRKAEIYRPGKPEPLRPGAYQEFRFRMNFLTPADEAAEKRQEYASYTGRSVVEVRTTKDTGLTFESHYHPYFIDRVNKALIKQGEQKAGLVVLQ